MSPSLWKWNRLSDAPFTLSHECFAHAFFGKFITLISLSVRAYTQVLQCACGGQRASCGLGAFLSLCGFCCRLNLRDQAWWQVLFLLNQIVWKLSFVCEAEHFGNKNKKIGCWNKIKKDHISFAIHLRQDCQVLLWHWLFHCNFIWLFVLPWWEI